MCSAYLNAFPGRLGWLSPVGAADRTDLSALQQQAEVDLNGNGKPEKITFNTDPKTQKFTITVAGSSQSGDYEPDFGIPKGFALVKIDKTDKYREIIIMCPRASDANMYYIFAYDGTSLNKIGEFSRSVEFPGDGSVLVDDWEGFWVIHDTYVLEKPQHTLKKVPQEFYYVGVPATVKKTFPIYSTPNEPTVVANVKPKSKVMILLCAPFKENLEGPKWYLLKTETGLIGWIKEEIIQDRLGGISWAG